jgi:hypothetical protein
MIKIILVTTLALGWPEFAWARDFDDTTPCSAIVTAAAQTNHMDMRRAGHYIVTALATMDRRMVAGGHQAMMDLITQPELLRMIADTSAMCHDRPTMTIHDAARGVYVTASMVGPG